ncbi:hypothetical protein Pla123a_07270 [Posidoniimonas polymericola]|uniref:Glycosyl transferase family 2 n=2 Tax=Posidoniimonas polymericola TaxID=2528002 RepID=A0A5C5ZFP0_9BACT|nr:hypothetical protein Pla123a_07270 [Posidoniimonas polymericola]
MLLEAAPDTELLQFVDGDCELNPTWLEVGASFLAQHPEIVAVSGRRRECRPQQSLYNRFIDREWDSPIGEALSTGGDFLVRAAAYVQAGGFDPSVPAGEEPELCGRLRANGGKVWRLDHEMTLHDANMNSFSEWWRRQRRAGYGALDVERRFRLNLFTPWLKSAVFWNVVAPIALLTAAGVGFIVAGPLAASMVLIAGGVGLLLQVFRLAWKDKRRGSDWRSGFEYGILTMLSKLPIFLGILQGLGVWLRGSQSRLMEYKTAGVAPRSEGSILVPKSPQSDL